MAKKRSEFLRGFGKMFEIVKAIVNEVLDLGGDDSDLERILKDKNLRRQLGTLIIGAKSAIKCSFVNLLAACKQNWVNGDFNEEHYPLEEVTDDENEWEVYEHHFPKNINGFRAFDELQKLGYRLCGPRRAMEYVAEHQGIQLDHPLIVTARWQYPRGDWCAPVFCRDWDDDSVGCSLNLYAIDDAFFPHCGWLVLRKRS